MTFKCVTCDVVIDAIPEGSVQITDSGSTHTWRWPNGEFHHLKKVPAPRKIVVQEKS